MEVWKTYPKNVLIMYKGYRDRKMHTETIRMISLQEYQKDKKGLLKLSLKSLEERANIYLPATFIGVGV